VREVGGTGGRERRNELCAFKQNFKKYLKKK
jgi:hypothetical protein